MKHFPNNPRQITKNQFARLQKTMQEFGDLSGIVHNLTDDTLIGGNQRAEAAAFINSEPVITERFTPALPDGTEAVGYFDFDGKRFNYRAVRWDTEKAQRANLVANAGGGNWDWDLLASFPSEVLDGSGFDSEMLLHMNLDALNLRLRIETEDGEFDPMKEWEGMPEFENQPKAIKSLIVHFENQDDILKFIEIIGQEINENTKFIWYPEKERRNMRDIVYVAES